MLRNNCVGRRILICGSTTILITIVVMKGVAWWRESRRRQLKLNTIPTIWRQVGEVEHLMIYPLKSGGGNQTNVAECTEVGLATINNDNVLQLNDRVFVVYNEKSGAYKTALQHTKMLLINVTSEEKHQVTLKARGMARDVHFKIPGSENGITTIHSNWMTENISTVDCGDEVATWISEFLLGTENGARLGYYVGEKPKVNVDTLPWAPFKKIYRNLRSDDYGLYSDMTSYMLLGQSSVDDLNRRLPNEVKPVTTRNFRPNIVVSGSAPYEEDGWDWIKIGENAVFRSVKPCTRCSFTTIDPDTGVMDTKSREPLKTLEKYRQLKDPAAHKLEGTSPVMGLYMGLYTPGLVKSGDPVFVGFHDA